MELIIDIKEGSLSVINWKGNNVCVQFKETIHDDISCGSPVTIIQVYNCNDFLPMEFSDNELKEMEKQWQLIMKNVLKNGKKIEHVIKLFKK